MKLIIKNYWWPKVIKNMGKYMDECNLCLKNEKP